MSLWITFTTTGRVLSQIRHDRRTIGLILFVPGLLIALLRYVFDSEPLVFDRVGTMMLGIFPFTSMFLVTSIAMLRERTSGTLERLLTTPLHKLDLLLGYGIAFAVLAALQAVTASAVAYYLLDLDTKGSPGVVMGIAVSSAVLGSSIGLLTSAFATSEFQAVQFMPVVVMPQVLLCGLFWPREEMIGWLQAASDVLPMTYSVDALLEVIAYPDPTARMWQDVAIIVAATVVALVLGAATLRRRTP
ncbi:MAG TPA: ABC transporter permease [Micromonosporaceae bacterium]